MTSFPFSVFPSLLVQNEHYPSLSCETIDYGNYLLQVSYSKEIAF